VTCGYPEKLILSKHPLRFQEKIISSHIKGPGIKMALNGYNNNTRSKKAVKS
jgi:hypothetical protein